METTTEKPVLDVEAPGVRVAVYAPTWKGGCWIAAEWHGKMNGPRILTPFFSKEKAERYARFTVWTRHVVGAASEMHKAVVGVLDRACAACPYRNGDVGCLSIDCPLHRILDNVNANTSPEKLVKRADWENNNRPAYPHGRARK